MPRRSVHNNFILPNLSVISKLLGRLVAKLRSADILPSLQSGFRPGHSTETATLRVFSENILDAIDSGDVAALVLLDGRCYYQSIPD